MSAVLRFFFFLTRRGRRKKKKVREASRMRESMLCVPASRKPQRSTPRGSRSLARPGLFCFFCRTTRVEEPSLLEQQGDRPVSREGERERAKEGGDGGNASISLLVSLSAILSLFFDCRRRPPSPACCCTPHHPGSPRRAFFRQSTAESASQSRPVSWRGPRSRQRWSSRDPSLSGRASVGVDVVDFEKKRKSDWTVRQVRALLLFRGPASRRGEVESGTLVGRVRRRASRERERRK